LKASIVKAELNKMADPIRARVSRRYFKTGPGEYGQGDCFLGVRVPSQRIIARQFVGLPLLEVEKLLKSRWHEYRLTGILILVNKYQIGTDEQKKEIFTFYSDHLEAVNNWDLVDVSAHKIIGNYLKDKDRRFLYYLADSDNLWFRRSSIIATFAFIDDGDLQETIQLATRLLKDKHDLIHKAVGWAIREVGKKDPLIAKKFLDRYHSEMPRTMLRYALEKFSSAERQHYLKR